MRADHRDLDGLAALPHAGAAGGAAPGPGGGGGPTAPDVPPVAWRERGGPSQAGVSRAGGPPPGAAATTDTVRGSARRHFTDSCAPSPALAPLAATCPAYSGESMIAETVPGSVMTPSPGTGSAWEPSSITRAPGWASWGMVRRGGAPASASSTRLVWASTASPRWAGTPVGVTCGAGIHRKLSGAKEAGTPPAPSSTPRTWDRARRVLQSTASEAGAAYPRRASSAFSAAMSSPRAPSSTGRYRGVDVARAAMGRPSMAQTTWPDSTGVPALMPSEVRRPWAGERRARSPVALMVRVTERSSANSRWETGAEVGAWAGCRASGVGGLATRTPTVVPRANARAAVNAPIPSRRRVRRWGFLICPPGGGWWGGARGGSVLPGPVPLRRGAPGAGESQERGFDVGREPGAGGRGAGGCGAATGGGRGLLVRIF